MSLPMEKATYSARAFAISFGEADNENSTKQVGVTFEIVEEVTMSDETTGWNPTGETISWIGFFTDKTAARSIESLCHCGWKGEDLSEFDGMDESAVRAALPDVVSLACEPEEYKQEWRLRVQWVNRHGGGRMAFKKPIAGNDLKSFAAQMRATVKGVRGAGGAPRARSDSGSRGSVRGSSGHPNAPGNTDDIPF